MGWACSSSLPLGSSASLDCIGFSFVADLPETDASFTLFWQSDLVTPNG
jgi:hypothetical protein